MDIPENFLVEEVRNNFYVPAMMKRCWAAQLEILDSFKKFCAEMDIRWFAAYGTLLGAVRHHGFIPWDDDIDVWMFRKDYEKFLLCVNMMPENLMFLDGRFGSEKMFDQAFGRIVNTVDPQYGEDFLKKYHGFPYMAGIDIFVLDNIAPDEDEEEERYQQSRYIIYVIQQIQKGNTGEEVQKLIDRLEEWAGVPIDRKDNLFKQLMLFYEGMNCLYDDARTEEVTAMHDWISNHNYKFKTSWFDDVVELPFENTTVPAPAGYHDVLSRWSGNTYMIPMQVTTHGYPYFKKYEEAIENTGTKLPYYYHFNDNILQSDKKTPRKSLISQFLQIFEKTTEIVVNVLQSADIQAINKTLEMAQDSAVKFSDFLQRNYPSEAMEIVDELNSYHEDIYRLYMALNNKPAEDKAEDVTQILQGIQECVRKVRIETVNKIIRPKEVVFLPFNTDGWSRMKPLYQYFRKQPDTLVLVAPVPYYLRNECFGTRDEAIMEFKDIEADVNTVPYESMVLSVHTPDIVVTQDGYDNYNVGRTIDPHFYSDELQKCAGQVVYIPWFQIDEPLPEHTAAMCSADVYIKEPGVLRADLVLVPSYNTRHVYIDKLTEFAGGGTWKRWEKSVQKADCEEDFEKIFG
jgi:phosphorylcholine metabolism protein LicD